jgi:ectoine hydroxylase-related dioxygenase (phytanoyl-CoA dioxygenase family)
MQLVNFNAETCNINELQLALDKHGYLILNNAISSGDSSQLHNDLEPYFNERAVSQALFFGFNTKRIEALLNKSQVVQKMATHAIVLELVGHLLKQGCESFQINLTQGIRINPGEKAQILHPDSALFPINNKPFEFVVNALWAYSDFTKDNGATVIVPGSHKWEEGRQPLPHEITYAEMKKGSVLIYAASLLHGGGANVANTSRTGVAISYCLGWLRQSENQYLSYPLEDVRQFSHQLQELIGYSVHKPNLGWVNGHSPMDILLDKTNDYLGAEDFLTDGQISILSEYHNGGNLVITNHAIA